MAALRAHAPNPGDEHILQDACQLLDHCSCSSDPNARAAVAAGVFEALVPVLRHAAVAHNEDEADAAVCVVASICVPVPQADCLRPWIDVAALWRAGVVHAMADTTKARPATPHVAPLHLLTCCMIVQVALRRSSNPVTALDLMGAFCGPLLAFLLLGKLSVEDELAAGALPACIATLAAMQPPMPGGDHRYLVALHKAVRLLDALTADEPARADAAVAAGALEAVEKHAPSMERFFAPDAIGMDGLFGIDALFRPRQRGSGRAAHDRVLERLRAAAVRHDAAPCAAPRCERCTTAKRTCALPGCGAAGGSLKLCARCKRCAYCCKEHQLQDWPTHKADCKRWRNE